MNRSIDALRVFVAASERPTRDLSSLRVVAVGGAKGGVGTSTVASLLAIEAARAGQKVLLVDADEDVGSLHLMMGFPHAGPGPLALREGASSPEDLVVSVLPELHLFASGGIHALEGDRRDGRILARRVTGLFEHYSMVILDAGSRVRSVVSACRSRSGRLLCVTSPDRISLASSYALLKVSRSRFPHVPVELVVNGVSEDEALRVHATVRAAAKRFMAADVSFGGAIPADDSARALVESGESLTELEPDSPLSTAAGTLVRRLIAESQAASSGKVDAVLRL